MRRIGIAGWVRESAQPMVFYKPATAAANAVTTSVDGNTNAFIVATVTVLLSFASLLSRH